MQALKRTTFLGEPPFPLLRSGKVRENYDLGEHLLVIATDRLSAFDVVLEEDPIPGKGRVLTQMSAHWFGLIHERLPWLNTHFVTANWDEIVAQYPTLGSYTDQWSGRAMLVLKADTMIEVEAIVRGYLEGSGLKDYKESGAVCGIPLPAGLIRCSKLPWDIFTPSTKAKEGHDKNITLQEAIDDQLLTPMQAAAVVGASLAVFNMGSDYADSKGILLGDTKLEFFVRNGVFMLGDEVLTPDSSRFWPKSKYAPGRAQDSLDKQPVRDFLENTDWDKKSPPPRLPEEVIQQTAERYQTALEMLTGQN